MNYGVLKSLSVILLLLARLHTYAADMLFENQDPSSTQESRVNQEPTNDVDIDKLYEGCRGQSDEICKMVVAIKELNDAAIENLRKSVPLGKFEYAVVAIGQYALNGNVEVRVPKLVGQWDCTIGYNRDEQTRVKVSRSF